MLARDGAAYTWAQIGNDDVAGGTRWSSIQYANGYCFIGNSDRPRFDGAWNPRLLPCVCSTLPSKTFRFQGQIHDASTVVVNWTANVAQASSEITTLATDDGGDGGAPELPG